MKDSGAGHEGELGAPNSMPEICRFLGIVIGIFYSEHGVAHFHAVYGEHEISVEVEAGKVRGDPAKGPTARAGMGQPS